MKADEFLRTTVLELRDIDEAVLVPQMVLLDLELDSLDYVEIQVGVKKNFGVSIDPELYLSGKIRTLGDLCDYIEAHRVGAASATAS